MKEPGSFIHGCSLLIRGVEESSRQQRGMNVQPRCQLWWFPNWNRCLHADHVANPGFGRRQAGPQAPPLYRLQALSPQRMLSVRRQENNVSQAIISLGPTPLHAGTTNRGHSRLVVIDRLANPAFGRRRPDQPRLDSIVGCLGQSVGLMFIATEAADAVFANISHQTHSIGDTHSSRHILSLVCRCFPLWISTPRIGKMAYFNSKRQ